MTLEPKQPEYEHSEHFDCAFAIQSIIHSKYIYIYTYTYVQVFKFDETIIIIVHGRNKQNSFKNSSCKRVLLSLP